MFETLFLLGTATLALNGVRPITSSFALSDLFYFAALIALVHDGLFHQKPVEEWLPLHPFWIPTLLILAGGFISSIGAVQPGESMSATIKTFFLFSFWFSMGIVMVRRKRVQSVVVCLVLGIGASAGIAVWDRMTGMALGPSLWRLHAGVALEVDPFSYVLASNRYSGTLGHPNQLGQFTALAIPLAFGLARSALGDHVRLPALMYAASAILLLYATSLSGSAAGLIGALLGVVLILVFELQRSKHLFRTMLVPLLLVMIGVGLFSILSDGELVTTWRNRLAVDARFERALNITGPGRVDSDGEAFSLIAEQPWVGYGMDQGSSADQSGLVTSAGIHNTLIRAWLGGGILVFLGLLWVYWKALSMSISGIRAFIQGHAPPYVVGLAVSVIVSVVIDMVQPSFYQRFAWLPTIMLYAILVTGAQQAFSPVVQPVQDESGPLALRLPD